MWYFSWGLKQVVVRSNSCFVSKPHCNRQVLVQTELQAAFSWYEYLLTGKISFADVLSTIFYAEPSGMKTVLYLLVYCNAEFLIHHSPS